MTCFFFFIFLCERKLKLVKIGLVILRQFLKPQIWIESHNMFGFNELFFLSFLPQIRNQSPRKESKDKKSTSLTAQQSRG